LPVTRNAPRMPWHGGSATGRSAFRQKLRLTLAPRVEPNAEPDENCFTMYFAGI
jgi:hypothetical protein